MDRPYSRRPERPASPLTPPEPAAPARSRVPFFGDEIDLAPAGSSPLETPGFLATLGGGMGGDPLKIPKAFAETLPTMLGMMAGTAIPGGGLTWNTLTGAGLGGATNLAQSLWSKTGDALESAQSGAILGGGLGAGGTLLRNLLVNPNSARAVRNEYAAKVLGREAAIKTATDTHQAAVDAAEQAYREAQANYQLARATRAQELQNSRNSRMDDMERARAAAARLNAANKSATAVELANQKIDRLDSVERQKTALDAARLHRQEENALLQTQYAAARGLHQEGAANTVLDYVRTNIPPLADLPKGSQGVREMVLGQGPAKLSEFYDAAMQSAKAEAKAMGRSIVVDMADAKALGFNTKSMKELTQAQAYDLGDEAIGKMQIDAGDAIERVTGFWKKNRDVYARVTSAINDADLGIDPAARKAYREGAGLMSAIDKSGALHEGGYDTDKIVSFLNRGTNVDILRHRNLGDTIRGPLASARGGPTIPPANLPEPDMPPPIPHIRASAPPPEVESPFIPRVRVPEPLPKPQPPSPLQPPEAPPEIPEPDIGSLSNVLTPTIRRMIGSAVAGRTGALASQVPYVWRTPSPEGLPELNDVLKNVLMEGNLGSQAPMLDAAEVMRRLQESSADYTD